MKKIVFAFLLSLGSMSYAQLYLGPEFGQSFIEVKNESIGRSFQPGWYGGAIVEYRFNNWFGIKTGFNYSQRRKGSSTYDTTQFSIPGFDIATLLEGVGLTDIDLNTYSETHSRIAFHFLEAPVMARFSWKDYYVGVGGYASYMVAAKTKSYSNSRTPFVSIIDLEPIFTLLGFPEAAFLIPPAYTESNSNTRSKSGIRSFDYGLKGSIGYQADYFGFNAMYQFGIPDYRTNPTGKNQRHQYLQLSVNYLFGFSSKEGKSSL